MKLFRPVGPAELAKIEAAGMRGFPPRLSGQPIFYPVLTFAYAEKIARDWNSIDAGCDFAGFVTAFEVDDAYLSRFSVETAGGSAHEELWIPADELEAFNQNIAGLIEIVAEYRNGRRMR